MINALSIKLSRKIGCHAKPRRSMRAKASSRVALKQATHPVIARNEAIAYYTEQVESYRLCTVVVRNVRLPRCARNDIFFI